MPAPPAEFYKGAVEALVRNNCTIVFADPEAGILSFHTVLPALYRDHALATLEATLLVRGLPARNSMPLTSARLGLLNRWEEANGSRSGDTVGIDRDPTEWYFWTFQFLQSELGLKDAIAPQPAH